MKDTDRYLCVCIHRYLNLGFVYPHTSIWYEGFFITSKDKEDKFRLMLDQVSGVNGARLAGAESIGIATYRMTSADEATGSHGLSLLPGRRELNRCPSNNLSQYKAKNAFHCL